MGPTTSHRPPGAGLSATAEPPRAPWLAAGLAVAALIPWAVIDVLRTTLAVGRYEDRIIVATHGQVDIGPAWFAYVFLDNWMPQDLATTVLDGSWIVGLLVAATAFITWLYRARRNAVRSGGELAWRPGWTVGGWWSIPVAGLATPYRVVRGVRQTSGASPQAAPVGLWWASVLVTVLLNRLIWLYDVVTSDGGAFRGTALDARTVAYPLWTAGTVTIVATVFLSARVVLRITEAQRPPVR